MEQYILKSAVVAEIEKLQDWCEEQNNDDGIDLLEKLFYKIDILDNLEVKEVDLEKEIGKYLDTNDIEFRHQIKLLDFAKYFFELGINARKEENK